MGFETHGSGILSPESGVVQKGERRPADESRGRGGENCGRARIRGARARGRPPGPVLAQLRRNFGDAQIVELTAAIAWENYRAGFDHALGVEAQGFSAGAACGIRAPGGTPSGASAILRLPAGEDPAKLVEVTLVG